MSDEKRPLLSHLMGSHTAVTWNAAHPIIGKRTFTPEEIMEWVKANNPKWLE